MEQMERAAAVMNEKKAMLLELAEYAEQMLSCQTEELEAYMEKRQRLIEQMQELDRELEGLTRDGQEASWMQAISGRGDRRALPQELRPLFDRSMEMRAIGRRIQNLDSQVKIRMELEREQLLLKIRSANQGQGAQAAKYSNMMGIDRTQGSRLGNA